MQWLFFIVKPAITLAIIVVALSADPIVSGRYRALILVGLVCSLAGDVLLMLPGDRFVPGLASFLVANLLYIATFGTHGGGMRSPPSSLVIRWIRALSALDPGTMALPRFPPLRIPASESRRRPDIGRPAP